MSFTPSHNELAIVTQIFAKADPQKIGILTGDAALKVFGGAKLAPTVLGEIWSIADEDNNGWLPRKGVAIAVRLMGWAQKGEKVTEALVSRPGPLPTIEGIQVPLAQQNTGISLPKSPPPMLPVLTPQDKAKYMGIFQSCKPRNGLLTGEQARDVFVKSKLPFEKLGQIWNLADTQNRGALDSTDFAVGMYLIKASMSGQLSFIPTSLPPGLYEQASGGGIVSHGTGGSGIVSPSSFTPTRMTQQYTGPGALQAQTTGQKRAPPVLPSRKLTAPVQVPNAFGNTTGQQAWDVTPAEKASADRFFDTLDTQKVDYIEGDVAVPFMLQSNLPEDTLAQVWDLADINNDGRLTRDGFAVAMHLIQGKLAGKEIPGSLPQNLIPPSMRTNGVAPPQEPVNLLWDETPPPSASPVPTQTQNSVFLPPPVSPPKPQTAVQDPFGSAAFGVSSSRNLLEDDDELAASSAPLQDQSAEIGNVQNQLNSTNRSLNAAKAEREPVEQTLATQAAQLSALQTQLSSAKAAYETETKLLSTLKDRMGSQTAEIQKAREELIRAESDLSAVRVEKAEIEGAFLRDKEDIRELHRKMAETGTEVAGLKLEIEKAKKEAKQQKGLLAIARKQLSTKDAEKAKVQKELDDAKDEIKEVTSERESVETELLMDAPSALQNGHDIRQSPFPQSPETDPVTAALAEPLPASLPVSPDPASPSGTSMKSNNPFDRLTRSTSSASSSRSQPHSFADPAPSATPPATTPAEATEDPFDFSRAFPEEPEAPLVTQQEPDSAATEVGSATPRQEPATLSIPPAPVEEQTISPGSEFGSELFSTPPTTADGLSQSPPNRMSEVPSIDSQFPALDHVSGSFPIPQERHDGETDLGGPLKELDIEESDSDNDEEPLSNLKHKLQASADNTPSKAAPPNGTSTLTTSFDDAFGSSTSGTESTDAETPRPSSTAPTDSLVSSFTSQTPSTNAFGTLLNKASSPFPVVDTATPAPPIAGVNAFDEAMGQIPSNGVASSAPDISFDSAFEDNFDFASASTGVPSFPPPPSVGNGNAASSPIFKPSGFQAIYSAQASNGISSLPPVDVPKQLSFEDAFSTTPPAPKPASQSTSAVWKASDSPSATISFDDAFGGVASSQALKLDSTFGSLSSKASTASSAIRQGQPASNLKPFPTPQSPPLSPQGGPSSPRISSIRSSTPPPRSASPPARLGSPGPRPSTSSSKEGHEKLKEPAPRHSRLSIRLPFGKKKTKESKESSQAPPVPSSHYNQFLSPVEEPSGPVTPAVEDDVNSVKQLCGMGFSRTQAVTALEKHGYDMQKALNSLLGTQ